MPISTTAPSPALWVRALCKARYYLVVALGFTLLTFAMTASHPSWKTVEGWARAFGTSLIFSTFISITIEVLLAAGRRLLGPRLDTLNAWQRNLFYWGTPLVGLVISVPLAAMVAGVTDAPTPNDPQLRTTPLGAAAFTLLVIAIFYGYFALRARQARAERQATEAQLRLLQGQMEPHFLFNTLANVIGLMDVDAPRAKLMLESFTDYLRASLGSLRHDDHTLGDELDLIDAYLRVVAIRMDDRLKYSVDVPAELRAMRLPALSLQPLVENAIVHGLEPKIEGGEVRIAARWGASGSLIVSVTDDGLGLPTTGASKTRGTGTALANIRERLLQANGDGGSLRLEPAQPNGVLATLTIARASTRLDRSSP
jgi:signal transduction histidine kinase